MTDLTWLYVFMFFCVVVIPAAAMIVIYLKNGTFETPTDKRRKDLYSGRLHRRIDELEKTVKDLRAKLNDHGAQD